MNNDLNDLVSDYLSDQLTPAEKLEFERQMAANPDVASRVALERDLAETLRSQTPEHAFRANLQRIAAGFNSPESLLLPGDKSAGNNKLKWWLAIFCMVLIGLFLTWQFFWNNSTVSSNPVPNPAESIPATETPRLQPPTESAPEIAKKPASKQPMAAVLKPIPALESYIGSHTRDGGFHFQVDIPANNTPLTQTNGRVEFQFAGKAIGQIPEDARYQVLIFNNNLHAFESMRPLGSIALAPKKQGDFFLKKTLYLASGLHYYLIEEISSGTWVGVGKFLVQ